MRALDGIDVEFAAGEFTCIMGPSDSGKSTLTIPSDNEVDFPTRAGLDEHVAEALNTVIQQVAATPFDESSEEPASRARCVRGRTSATLSG